MTLFEVGHACGASEHTGGAAGPSANRTFPSIFMAWSDGSDSDGPDNDHSSLARMARHDLLILSPQQMGLGRIDRGEALAPAAVDRALAKRRELARLNPNAVVLAEVRYYDAWQDYLPPDSPLWRRDKSGEPVISGGLIYGARQVYLLDFSKPELRDSVAAQCKAYVETGVFDGCMFDWWNGAYSDTPGAEGTDRLKMIQMVRAAVGDKALLIGNVNGSLPKMTASYLNGVYMEGFGSKGFADWRQAVANLVWLEAHLRAPAVTALEGWYDCGDCSGDPATIEARGRGHLALMREVTTLSLTNSDGYVLFGDPDALPTLDHLHSWYSFWDKTLGRPVGPKGVRSQDGSYRRAFGNGCVVFNPPDNRPVTITFPVPHRSQASGIVASSFSVDGGDGDIFLLNESRGGGGPLAPDSDACP
ncbi:MAG: hypothetical protein IPK66_15795 [Rhodospirillales bacterium]|nr:hypothetical protein [Rhodospirillales bacterium]